MVKITYIGLIIEFFSSSINQKILGDERRSHFRVLVQDVKCMVKLVELENKKLKQLANKVFLGQIDNLSASGLKLMCDFDFPIQEKIIVELTFEIKDEIFTVKGEVIRKEEYRDKKYTHGYGIKFIQLREQDQTNLSKQLNRILIEKRMIV